MASKTNNTGGRVLVATLGESACAPEPLLESIAARWPRDAQPVFERAELTDLTPKSVGSAALLIVACDNCDTTTLARVVDGLHVANAPAVILTPCDRESLRRIEGSGIIVESQDADPERLAVELFTLCERQSMIVEQATALRTSMAAAGGARGEIERVHEELQLAATVQRDLIPAELPRSEELDIGVLFRPAAYVSGDIFDAVRLDDRRIGFLVADAMGHGVPAALMTMVVSKGLKKIEHTDEGARVLPPAEAMEWLNSEMCERQGGGGQRFVTAVYAVLDTVDGKVTFCIAGHPAPLVVRNNGSVDQVEATGPLLGVFDGAEFEQVTVDLAPGESVVLYSDGFETAFPGEEGSGKPTREYVEHLSQLGRVSEEGSLTDNVFGLCMKLDQAAGSLHQDDDLTIVSFRRLAGAGENRDEISRPDAA